jgi:hypothetical protein
MQGIIGQNGAFEKKADSNKLLPIRATAGGFCRRLASFSLRERGR